MKRKQAFKHQQAYRSYLSTYKRKRSDALFEWLKTQYMKMVNGLE